MDVNFTDNEILFIYGHFQKHIEQLNRIKESPGVSIDSKTFKQELSLYSSITDKIAMVYPQYREMDKYI